MKKVFVAMSGGVDSSLSAYLLKESGYDVTGMTFVINDNRAAADGASEICKFLNIPHRVIDLREAFSKKIVDYFISSYQQGRTPNPCSMCNPFIKFGLFQDIALENNALFATGHYIRLREVDNEIFLERGSDPGKDQSYFLSLVPHERFRSVLFPLGNYHKPQVKEMARKIGLPIPEHKGESQDACFVDGDYRDYLREHGVKETPGDFIYNGTVVGKHPGIPFISFGQRRRLRVSVGQRVFAREYDTDNNRVILGEKPLSRRFRVKGLNLFTDKFKDGRYDLQVRYQSKVRQGKVQLSDDAAEVVLDESHEIIAPGQIAVFYKDNLVYAGGEIDSVELE